ncbi:SPRY domain-containing SOCS box protein 3-like [Colletes gigas]|uniref:SPRY domain-containing SOCS box protein 3-like n=1 Tax=Colletes gigas TaxID=935657 RepID=UPI001C9B1779|nr:SPRY domain-containing SOCS box protein 3-like [Colletes gigas]
MSFEHNSTQPVQYEIFCNCKLQDCRCGENNVFEWTWDKEQATDDVVLSEQNLEIQFRYNHFGIKAVKGNKLLEKEKHHYWEIKILNHIPGTNIVIGVGTNNMDLNGIKDDFYLGFNYQSYVFSSRGYIQHNEDKCSYGPSFGQGSLVGIYLNTWRGTLEFFLNRKPLGIAFNELRGIMLYPLVGSRNSESKIRLTHSCSVPASLQVECLAVLKSSQREYLSTMLPGLQHLSKSIFADILKKNLSDNDEEKDDLDFLTDCMIFDEYDFALVGCGRKKEKK